MENPTQPVRLPQGREPVIRVIPMPGDSNPHGDVFGGWIMSQVDLAGSVPATAHAQGRVATVAVNAFVFKEPVFVGDLLSISAHIEKVGRTSMTVYVEVFAQRRYTVSEVVRVTEAYLTYVATDDNRKPRAVPPLA